MNLKKDSKYQLTPRQISSNLSGEVVILDHEKGIYYGLDEVGALIYGELEKEPQTIETLCSLVCAEYGIDGSECRTDIELLIEDLIKEKLVEEFH
jgi:hypothetical protein